MKIKILIIDWNKLKNFHFSKKNAYLDKFLTREDEMGETFSQFFHSPRKLLFFLAEYSPMGAPRIAIQLPIT